MSRLLYREDADEARARLTSWWHGGDIGRPPVLVTAPRPEPVERVEALPAPPGWVTNYSTRDFAYRANLAARACVGTEYVGEELPVVSPDLGPCCLALFLGCHGIEMPGTVWCEPCLDGPADPSRLRLDREGFYWNFGLRLGREMRRLGQGRMLVQFPDLIEGLDTLASLRGSERLLVDLVERPAWVHASLRRITDLYFHAYDILYDQYRDESGGSYWWMWAPGRMAKLQCDFSAMISPAMFGEYMVPVLTEMTERLSYSMYHWDGPGAIGHLDHLLSIPRLGVIQWTPGSGVEPVQHRRWWPLFHRIVEAGKKAILIGGITPDEVRALKREFGEGFKQLAIKTWARSRAEAEAVIAAASP